MDKGFPRVSGAEGSECTTNSFRCGMEEESPTKTASSVFRFAEAAAEERTGPRTEIASRPNSAEKEILVFEVVESVFGPCGAECVQV